MATLGATLVAVSPQRPEWSREVIRQHHLGYPLLEDHGNEVARRFGLVFTLPDDLRRLYEKNGVDLARYNGEPSWTLPMPGRFVIDATGIVRAASADPDYTVRPDPAETVAVLQSLAGAAS